MRHPLTTIFLLFTLLSPLTACVSAVSGTRQQVYLQAVRDFDKQPLPGTRCALTDKHGRSYPLVSNPGKVLVRKGQGNLSVVCMRPGYHQIAVHGCRGFDPLALADFAYWPALAFDISAGAILPYPSTITVVMARDTNEPYVQTPLPYDFQVTAKVAQKIYGLPVKAATKSSSVSKGALHFAP